MIILVKGKEAQQNEIERWIRSLLAAEAAAEVPDQKKRSYQITYRISDSGNAPGPTEDERRAALVQLIQALKPHEHHSSTSCWRVSSHIQKASALRGLLQRPLNVDFDFLSVAQISPTNQSHVGNADLVS